MKTGFSSKQFLGALRSLSLGSERLQSFYLFICLGRNIGGETTSKLLIVEALYLDRADLKQSQSDVKREGGEKKEKKGESPTPRIKSLFGTLEYPPKWCT